MNKLKAFATAAAVLASSQAMAQTGMTPEWYAGVAYQAVNIDSNAGGDADVGAVVLRGGAKLHPNIAVEGRYGFGVQDDDQNGVTTELDDFYGVYAKGIAPVHPMVSLYGLVGYTRGEASISGPGGSASDTEDDISYGVGVDVKVHENISINGEWVQYMDGDSYEVQGYGVGVNFKF